MAGPEDDIDVLEALTLKGLRGVEPAYDFAGTEARLDRIMRVIKRARAAEAKLASIVRDDTRWTCHEDGDDFELHRHMADAVSEFLEQHDVDSADEGTTLTVYEHAVIPHEINLLEWVRANAPDWLPKEPS